MNRNIPLLLSILFLLMVLACNDNNNKNEANEEAIGNPTPEEILSDDKDEDIFPSESGRIEEKFL